MNAFTLLFLSTLASTAAADPVRACVSPTQATPGTRPQTRGGADPSDDAFEMGSPPKLGEGLAEEDIWPAATAEGWQKPCLVKWQRTFEDAMRVAREENRPLLVAVNMDGEIASEHFAGVRYREPATAELMSSYACVIGSVYRHTERDYDENGRRIECPRFGRVTCSEHIQVERELYDKYFDGRRISPRHLVLDLEGNENLDVYYSWDTKTVFTTFVKGVEDWPEPNNIERSLTDKVRSADVDDRRLIERTYREGSRETRQSLLAALLKDRVVDQVELLREAIFGLDLELAAMARRALAECETDGALDLMAEVLQSPLEKTERERLLAAVERLGSENKRARTLAALHSGLSGDSTHIVRRTQEDLAAEYAKNSGRSVRTEEHAGAVAATPDEPGAQLDLAAALFEQAADSERRFADLLYGDALAAAKRAEKLGATGPRMDALLAVCEDASGNTPSARQRAVAAIEGGLLRGDDGAVSGGGELALRARMRLLRLFAEARQGAIRRAYRSGGTWPPEWLSDVNAAYSEVILDPTTDDGTLVQYYDFLRWIGATPRANRVLDGALSRRPDSPRLHDRLRSRFLFEGGPKGLEDGYKRWVERSAADAEEATQATWFAGYASLVAAEQLRRRNRFGEARGAYVRAVDYYEQNIAAFPAGKDTCDHFIALAHAGIARLELEQGNVEVALDQLVQSFTVRPDSAATPDGLNLTPIQTAKMLMSQLEADRDEASIDRLAAALETLDPDLFGPVSIDVPGSPTRNQFNFRRRR